MGKQKVLTPCSSSLMKERPSQDKILSTELQGIETVMAKENTMNKMTCVEIPAEMNGPSEIVT